MFFKTQNLQKWPKILACMFYFRAHFPLKRTTALTESLISSSQLGKNKRRFSFTPAARPPKVPALLWLCSPRVWCLLRLLILTVGRQAAVSPPCCLGFRERAQDVDELRAGLDCRPLLPEMISFTHCRLLVFLSLDFIQSFTLDILIFSSLLRLSAIKKTPHKRLAYCGYPEQETEKRG